MSLTLVALPAARRLMISDLCRHLLPGTLRAMAVGVAPADGDLAVAEVLAIGRHPSLELASGRRAELEVGDRIVVTVGRVYAPLEFSGEVPAGLDDCALLSASGAAGIVTGASPGAAPTRLRLLGLVVDADGQVLNLARLRPAVAAPEEALRIAVVSCARGCHATKVTAALVRGFARGGIDVGVAKPTGAADAAERWRFLDAGATAAVDVVDAGRLCSADLDTSDLVGVTTTLLGALNGNPAVLLRIAGGLARRDTRALLMAPALAGRIHGVVLAAADALSAIEGARRIAEAGLPLLAVSGAICRSPLAMAEARSGLDCPVVDPQALSVPARLQALLAPATPSVHGAGSGRRYAIAA